MSVWLSTWSGLPKHEILWKNLISSRVGIFLPFTEKHQNFDYSLARWISLWHIITIILEPRMISYWFWRFITKYLFSGLGYHFNYTGLREPDLGPITHCITMSYELHDNITYAMGINNDPQCNENKGNDLDAMVPLNYTEEVVSTKDPRD